LWAPPVESPLPVVDLRTFWAWKKRTWKPTSATRLCMNTFEKSDVSDNCFQFCVHELINRKLCQLALNGWKIFSLLLWWSICSKVYTVYSVSQKKSPLRTFQNGWEFFNQKLHAYYAFISTLDCEFLFKYLQVWRNYAILSVTTQWKSCVQNVHHQPKCIFWHFPQTVWNF